MSDATIDFELLHAECRPKVLRYLTRLAGEHEAENDLYRPTGNPV